MAFRKGLFMKKSVCLVRLFAGLLCLMAATSCVIPLNPQGNLAGFSIRLGSANARSLETSALQSWKINASNPSCDPYESQKLSFPTTTQKVSGLVPGDWTIVVSGYDAAGNLIQMGTKVVTLEAGGNQSVEMPLQMVTNLTLTLSLDENLVTNEAPDHFLFVPISQTVTLTAPTGYDSYWWFLDSSEYPSSTTNVFTSAAGVLSSGRHRVQLVVRKGSEYYSDEVLIEVGGS